MNVKTLHRLGIILFAGLLLAGCSGVVDSEGSADLPGTQGSAGPSDPGAPGRWGQEPVITDITPFEAKAGETVVIKGKGFKNNQKGSTVTIGGVEAGGILSWSKDEIVVEVPEGAQKGVVIVNVNDRPSNMWPLNVLWSAENPENVLVSTTNNQWHDNYYSQIASDGSGGGIITWVRNREDESWENRGSDIYAQRVNSSGGKEWGNDGVLISTFLRSSKYYPKIISDGEGGAIITWKEYPPSHGRVLAQRVDKDGNIQWEEGGVLISSKIGVGAKPEMVSDGEGGAIIVWYVALSNWDRDLYAQRVDGSGLVQWGLDGVHVFTAYGLTGPKIISDGGGGAVITWYDYRNENWDIYAQRIDATGWAKWTTDGVPICTAEGTQQIPSLVSDGMGGAIITWEDRGRAGSGAYAQRVNSSGLVQWGLNGAPFSREGGYFPEIISDAQGGAIITWTGSRNLDIRVQRVDSNGMPKWAENGPVISPGRFGPAFFPKLIADGLGGAVITWAYTPTGWDSNIFAQRVDSSGTAKWTSGGVTVSGTRSRKFYFELTSDGWGGAVIVWADYRSGRNWDIYAQGISGTGRQ